MRDEAASVGRDGAGGLADSDSGGFLADHPASENRLLAVELRKRSEGLVDEAFNCTVADRFIAFVVKDLDNSTGSTGLKAIRIEADNLGSQLQGLSRPVWPFGEGTVQERRRLNQERRPVAPDPSRRG